MPRRKLPERIQAIEDRRFVVWDGKGPDPAIRMHFDERRIPVDGLRQVRVWGVHSDNEGQSGDKRIPIQAEKFWQVNLIAKDGSKFEVNASQVRAALD